MKITVRDYYKSAISQYAAKELIKFLEQYTNHQIGDFDEAERFFILDTISEKNAEDTSYQVKTEEKENVLYTYLRGKKENGILYAVYEALERMGISFQMNSSFAADAFDITACDNVNTMITPICRFRGIRQHINFPMDISSYSIMEAKEYIRNLARMKMNCITFHSYTGQWHGYESGEKKVYAGNFFYGQRHTVPEYEMVAKSIRNQKYYCIPEIESQLAEEPERSEFAVRWLGKLMETAKEVGMRITLSIELPNDETQDSLVQIVRNVLISYPYIDAIEWISPEGGGDGSKFTLDELEERIRDYFGEKVFEDGRLPYIPDAMPESLPGTMDSLKRAVSLYHLKDKIFDGLEKKDICIGLYVMCRHTLKVLKNIMAKVLPEHVILTFLSAHGSLAVAENIEFMEFTKEELQRTLIYSWIEFDGNMYLQQCSSKGIDVLLKQTLKISEGKSIFGMCFNHWRTGENEIVAKYMSNAVIQYVDTKRFYQSYARTLKINKVGNFCIAMKQLEIIDCFNRDNLFNIGFCYLGCWLMYPGLGWIREWKKKDMEESVTMYQEVIDILTQCLENTRTTAGINQLRFLINRMECSILQIKCIENLTDLCDKLDDHNQQKISNQEKEYVLYQCSKALDLSKQYLEMHMKYLPDRGCEGTAVSYYATIPVYIDHIRQYFVYGEEVCPHQPEAFDQPPAPDTAYLY